MSFFKITTTTPFPIKLTTIIGLLLLTASLPAQLPEVAVDIDSTTTPQKKSNKKWLKNYWNSDYPSPKKAATLAVIPGLGQIYNKKYWKLPIVYGLLGGVIYSIDYNTKEYRKLQETLETRAGTIAGTDFYVSVPTNAVTAQRNSTDKYRQLSWIGLIGFYLISAGDAFVDAHLKDFNVSDDLSFRPVIQTDFNNQPLPGIGVFIPLGK